MPWFLTSQIMESGAHASDAKGFTDPWNEAGTTPTIVKLRRFRSTTRPMMDGSAAKRLRQRFSLMTRRGLPPGFRSSSGRNVRPSSGLTPSSSKKLADTISA